MKLTRLNELIEDGKVVKGRWEITPDHEIQYRSEGKDEEIKLKGTVVAAEPGKLVLSVTEKQSDQKKITSLAALSGRWSADEKNRLVFEAERKLDRSDRLVFEGAWKLDEGQQIVYGFTQENLKTKKKKKQELVLKGRWEISSKNAVAYSLGGDSDSQIRFRGAFQTKSIFAKKNEIRYQIGVEVQGKQSLQTIIFFGQWKFSRDWGVSFEIESKGSRKKTVEFTRDLFKGDGEGFVRFQKSAEEFRLETGARILF